MVLSRVSDPSKTSKFDQISYKILMGRRGPDQTFTKSSPTIHHTLSEGGKKYRLTFA